MDALSSTRKLALATYYGAEGRLVRMVPTAISVLRARFGYGIGPFAFSLFDLAKVPRSRWNDYLVHAAPLHRALLAASPRQLHCLVRNKVLFHEHCLASKLPDIPILCRVGGSADPLGGAVELVEDAGRFAELLESAPPRLFAKAIGGAHGEGAMLVARLEGGYEYGSQRGSAAELFAHLKQACGPTSGFIIQPHVRPHPKMLPLSSPKGLPTARVVTAMRPGGPEPIFAFLKIPVGASVTDNFAYGTTGNLLAEIDVSDGTLGCAFKSMRKDWPVMVRVAEHPDSGFPVAGSRMPFWNEIVRVALRGQESLPALKTIGWDVAASCEGVVLVEANSLYDVEMLQVTQERGLKTEMAKLGIFED
jgi:hypothetical protein